MSAATGTGKSAATFGTGEKPKLSSHSFAHFVEVALSQGVRQPSHRAQRRFRVARHDLRHGVADQGDRHRAVDHDSDRPRQAEIKDKVAKYIPEFAQNGKQDITIEDAPAASRRADSRQRHHRLRAGPAQAWKNIYALTPQWKPGTHFAYSDVGYIDAGETGRSGQRPAAGRVRAEQKFSSRWGWLTRSTSRRPIGKRLSPRRSSATVTG